MNRYFLRIACIFVPLTLANCMQNQQVKETTTKNVQLVTLDPGHFHAALVQKTMYEGVDPVVHVYAPEGPDVQLHQERIEAFNTRQEDPTSWKQEVYKDNDFFEKMISEKAGNVVVLAGNNQKKTEYINQSLEAGFNVLADKPMAINSADFELLKKAFEIAKTNDLLLYDIMTERFEITTMLQKEFSLLPEVFGQLEKGTLENPAVTKESVHHFYKYVSGAVLTRPPWFMDVEQEGEGIVDVTTHLVDLVQWECFPDQVLDYEEDVEVLTASRWPTDMSLNEFQAITKMDTFPDYLKKDVVNDTILRVFSNGEINYKLRDIHAKVSVIWAYKAPEGAGDTHYSIMRGSKANLIIRQGKEQDYKAALYIEPIRNEPGFEKILINEFEKINNKFPGLSLQKNTSGWEVIIPDHYKESHEAHFARVTQNFLEYLKKGNMPEWEVPNMLAKYYTTIKGLELAGKQR